MSTSDDIKRVKEALIRRSRKLVQGLTLETHRRLVLRTPVDTGRARGNWMLSVDEPDSSTRPDNFDRNGAAAAAEAAGFAKQVDFGDNVFIVNNLPYIEPLENGHSKQAPNGMVAVTVAEMQAFGEALVQQLERGG